MGFFTGIEQAQMSQGGIYYEVGRYRAKINAVKMITSGRDNSLKFVVETTVLASTNPIRPAGMGVSYVVPQKFMGARGMIKEFIAAAMQVDPRNIEQVNAEVTEAVCEMVVGPTNPLAGQEVDLEVTPAAPGKNWCKHHWFPSGTLAL